MIIQFNLGLGYGEIKAICGKALNINIIVFLIYIGNLKEQCIRVLIVTWIFYNLMTKILLTPVIIKIFHQSPNRKPHERYNTRFNNS